MNIPSYIIKENPAYTPIYKLSRPKHCFEITDGEYKGLIFSFGQIDINEGIINFNYDILYLPEHTELDKNIEQVVGIILNNLIERGYYELNAK